MRAVSTAGAVHLARLLHRDPVASVYAGSMSDTRMPVVVTLANQRVDGSRREVFLDWGARVTRLSAHPHIAPIVAVGLTETGCPYVAVRATRTTLADVLRESGPPPAGQVRALGVALADTLAVIHDTGLIHGALQPATVLSGPGRKLLVAGFDATAPVLAHSLPPSAYTAPEHLEAATAGSVCASPAADVYDLATLLYGALGGRLPWISAQRQNLTDPMLRAAPVPNIPGVSTALTDVLGQAMHADPKQRMDAGQLRDLLSNVDISRPLAPGQAPTTVSSDLVPRCGPRPTPLPGGADVAVPPRKRSRRRVRVPRPAKVMAGVMLAFVTVGGAGLATFAATHASAEPSCPSDSQLNRALRNTYDGATVTDKLCGDDGYVAVTAEAPEGPDTLSTKSNGGPTQSLHIALRAVDGKLILVEQCDANIPVELRDYLDCG